MVIVDTSAWVEFFRAGRSAVAEKVDRCLGGDLVGIGDLIYCEVMQGLHSPRERKRVGSLFLSLPRFEMVGFAVAEKSAANYRLLRSRGVTVRKTIDVLIGTFCAERGFEILHNDRDFTLMVPHIGLRIAG
jgi:predicted nucleic acid-binding protein